MGKRHGRVFPALVPTLGFYPGYVGVPVALEAPLGDLWRNLSMTLGWTLRFPWGFRRWFMPSTLPITSLLPPYYLPITSLLPPHRLR